MPKADININVGADIRTSTATLRQDLKNIARNLKNLEVPQITVSLNKGATENILRQQLQNIVKNIKLNVDVTPNIKQDDSAKPQKTSNSSVPFRDFNIQDIRVSTKAISANTKATIDNKNALAEVRRAEAEALRIQREKAAAARTEITESRKRIQLKKEEATAVNTQTTAATRLANMEKTFRRQVGKPSKYKGTEWESPVSDIYAEFAKGKYADMGKLKLNIATVTKDLDKAGKLGKTAWEQITGKYAEYSRFLLVSGSIAMLRKAFGEMINVVKELNQEFVNIQMVTGGTAQQTANLMRTYNQMAQQLGATTKEVSQSANEWLRQGLSIADTNKLIETSMVLSKVGMLSSAEATQYLTSAMKGYKISAQDAMSIVDKVSTVDMVSATSAAGLMEGMSRVANFANQVGFSMDRLLGTLATIGEVTQKDMSSVGDSVKTMFARMSNIKLGKLVDDETGESLSDVETVLKNVSIKLRENETDFRNYGDILDEVAGRWSSFNDVQKNSISTAFAGKQRIEDFITLMNNYDNVLKYTGESINSAGTAMEKFSVYQEGIEASSKKLIATFEGISQSFMKSGFIKGFYDFSNIVLKSLDVMGLFKNSIMYVISAITLWKGTQITEFLKGFSLHTKLLNAELVLSGGVYKNLTNAQMANLTTTNLLKLGFIGLGQAIKASFLSNPFGWILTGVTLLLPLFDEIVKSAKKQAEISAQLKSEYDELTSTISGLNDELKTTNDRLAELYAKQKNGGLTFVEQEELDRLEAVRKELGIIATAKENERKQKENELNESIKKEYEKEYETEPLLQRGRRSSVSYYEEDVDSTKKNDVLEAIDIFSRLNKKKSEGIALTRYQEKAYEDSKKLLTSSASDYADFAERYTVDDDTRKGWLDMADTINKTLDPNSYKANTFNDVFNSSDFKSSKEELLKLSKTGKLDDSVINSYSELTDVMSKTGLSSEDLITHINSLTAETDKLTVSTINSKEALISSLTNLSGGFEVIDKIYADVKNKGTFDFTLLDDKAFKDTFSKLGNSYTDFIEVVSNSPSDINKCQSAFDSLITTWLTSKDALSSLDDSNKQVAISMLKNMGVANAEVVVNKALKKSKVDLAYANVDLTKTVDEQIISLSKELQALGYTRLEADKLSTAYVNAQDIMTNSISEATKARLKAYGLELEAITSLASALSSIYKSSSTNIGIFSATDYSDYLSMMEDDPSLEQLDITSFNEIKNANNKAIELGKAREKFNKIQAELGKINYTGGTKANKESSSGSSPTDKTIDKLKLEIDRYTELESAVLDAKNAIDELSGTEKNLSGQQLIDNLDEQVTAYQKLAQAYNNTTWEQKQQRSELRSFMEQNGFSFSGGFDSTNLSTNYAEQLESMYDTYNNMSAKTDDDKNKRAEYKQDIEDIESSYKKIISLNSDIYSSQNNITDALQKQKDLLVQQEEVRGDIVQAQIDSLKHEIGLTQNLGDNQDLLKIINNNKQIKTLLHERAEVLRKAQADTGIDYTKELNSLSNDWWSTEDEIVSAITSMLDTSLSHSEDWISSQESLDKLTVKGKIDAYNRILKNVENVEALITANVEKESQAQIELFKATAKARQEYQIKLYQANKDALKDSLEKTKELIEKNHENELAFLEEKYKNESELRDKNLKEELDSFNKRKNAAQDFYKIQIDMLDKLHSTSNYQDDLNKLETEKDKIQQQIDALGGDDSTSTRQQRVTLQKNLADKLVEIEKLKSNREYEVKKQALQDDADLFDKHYDDLSEKKQEEFDDYKENLDKQLETEKKQLEEKYSEQNKYKMALEALQSQMFTTIQKDGTSTYESLTTAYQNFAVETGEAFRQLGDDFNDFLTLLKDAQTLLQENPDLLQYAINTGNISSSNSSSGKSYSPTSSDEKNIIAMMKSNSDAWYDSTVDDDVRNELHRNNLELGARIGAEYRNGRWYKNGLPLYHDGKIGIDSDEEATIILKKESVLTEPQMKFVSSKIQGFEALAEKMKAVVFQPTDMISNAMSKLSSFGNTYGFNRTVSNNNSNSSVSNSPKVSIENNFYGKVDKADLAQSNKDTVNSLKAL